MGNARVSTVNFLILFGCLANCAVGLHGSSRTRRQVIKSDQSRTGFGDNKALCTGENGSGFHPDPEDCRMFYQCAFWNANRQRCPASLYYSVELQVCDFKQNVACNNTRGQPAVRWVDDRRTTTVAPITRPTTTTTSSTTTTDQSAPRFSVSNAELGREGIDFDIENVLDNVGYDCVIWMYEDDDTNNVQKKRALSA